MLEQKIDNVEQVPWTIQQTFLGIFFTLVPWITLAVVLGGVNASVRPARSTPLTTQQDLLNAIVTFVLSTLIEAAFLIGPFYFANRVFRTRPPLQQRSLLLQSLGFRRFDVGTALGMIVALFLAFYAVNVLYQYLLTTFHLNLQTNDQFILQHSKDAPLTTYATLIASVLVAPFCEEIFFRSFVFMGLLRGMPLIAAIIFSALIFAVAHADFGSFAVLFFIGLALAFLRWRTRSIWPGVILHALNNGIGALLIVLTMRGIIQ